MSTTKIKGRVAVINVEPFKLEIEPSRKYRDGYAIIHHGYQTETLMLCTIPINRRDVRYNPCAEYSWEELLDHPAEGANEYFKILQGATRKEDGIFFKFVRSHSLEKSLRPQIFLNSVLLYNDNPQDNTLFAAIRAYKIEKEPYINWPKPKPIA